MGTPESPSAPLSPLWDRSSGEGGGGGKQSIAAPPSHPPNPLCLSPTALKGSEAAPALSAPYPPHTPTPH